MGMSRNTFSTALQRMKKKSESSPIAGLRAYDAVTICCWVSSGTRGSL